MSEQPDDVVRKVTEGGIAAVHPPAESHPVLAAPATANQFNTIRAALIPIACWRVEDLRFDFDSSFVKPEARDEFQHLAALIVEHRKGAVNPPLSVFGHADPSGSDDYNKQMSGRRATAVYAILTRNTDLWEELYSQPMGGDDWSKNPLQIMTGFIGSEQDPSARQQQIDSCRNSKQKRQALFLDYMDAICTDKEGKPFKQDKTDFIAQGKDPKGKGDYQGCGEFNPLMLFTQEEEAEFAQRENKAARNVENAPNRRVLVLLYRPGVKVEPDRWPCPRAKEGVSACKKRLWSDGEKRRSTHLPGERRLFENTHDTFACRFYQRSVELSPCERLIKSDTDSGEPIGDAEEGAWYEEFIWVDFLASKDHYDGDKESFGPKATQTGMQLNTGKSPDFSDDEKVTLQKLINGEYAQRGQYTVESGLFQFGLGELQSILKRYVEEYWLDRNGNPIKPYNSMTGGPDFSLPQPNGEATQSGGDSPGIEIEGFPAWEKLFENRLIALGAPSGYNPHLTYTSDAKASQRLVEAFLNAYAEAKLGFKIHPSLIEFFAHVGQSETNAQAGALCGSPGANDWCMPASTIALIRGLYIQGYRFKKAGPITGTPARTYQGEIQRQIGLMSYWQSRPGNTLTEAADNPVKLEDGDIVSWVSGGSSPLSGHVATVLRCLPPVPGNSKQLGIIECVSGNAKGVRTGDGSIRTDQAWREQVPDRFPERYKKQSRIYNRIHRLNNDLEKNHVEQQKLQDEGKAGSPEHLALVAKATEMNVEIGKLKVEALQDPAVPFDRILARPGIDVPDKPGKVWVTTVIKGSSLKPYKKNPASDPPPEPLERCPKLKELYSDAPD